MELSRRAIPYTPFDRDLSDTTVALVSTAGVHLRTQEPFATEGDGSYRVIPSDTPAGDLMITHTHYDHDEADRDINCVFPIERLREMVGDGTLKALNADFFGMMGYTLRMKQVIEETGPEIARRLERSPTDLVLLTGGWPLCHRTVVHVQRAIEAAGIPTMLITVDPGQSAQARPPRAVHPLHHRIGTPLGPAGDAAMQRRTIERALSALLDPIEPGTIRTVE